MSDQINKTCLGTNVLNRLSTIAQVIAADLLSSEIPFCIY